MLAELSRVRYVQQFVLTLAQATREQFEEVQYRLSGLHGEVRVLWQDGPRMQHLYRTLEENRLQIGPDGKGRQCWMAYGYILASRKADVIALHDCDIVNYSRELLARLCYPVVHPDIGFEFSKGYYARLSHQMHEACVASPEPALVALSPTAPCAIPLWQIVIAHAPDQHAAGSSSVPYQTRNSFLEETAFVPREQILPNWDKS